MSTCPKCKDTELRHTLVAGHLPAHSCHRCQGILVGLVTYRQWRETHGNSPTNEETAEQFGVIPDTKDAMACCRCGGIMTKYRFSAEADNRIDYCASCEDIWMDGGEWELMESFVGSEHLAKIFTQPWQRQIHTQTVEKLQSDRLQSLFGTDFEKVSDIKRWIDEHTDREKILAYLLSSSR